MNVIITDTKSNVTFDSSDIGSMDITLALVIKPMLEQFRNTTTSYPAEFHIDNDETKSFETWKLAIDKMIYSFNMISREQMVNNTKKHEVGKVREGLKLFAKHYLDLWI